MTTEKLGTFDPREINKPFSVQINLVPDEDGLIVNEDFIIAVHRRNSETMVQFVCSNQLWVFNEEMRQKGVELSTNQPEERAKSVSFRVSHQPNRRIIYVGPDYEIHCIYNSSQNTVFDIKAVQPIRITQVPRNRDSFRQTMEGFIKRRN